MLHGRPREVHATSYKLRDTEAPPLPSTYRDDNIGCAPDGHPVVTLGCPPTRRLRGHVLVATGVLSIQGMFKPRWVHS